MELWTLPVPATALVEGPTFAALPKRQCEISFYIEGNDGASTKLSLLFERVEAFKCTYLTSCTAEMFNAAYGKLVRLGATPWLSELLKTYNSSALAPKTLQHLMICFDDGPCYEIICIGYSVSASGCA
jgi:hypothetical protein